MITGDFTAGMLIGLGIISIPSPKDLFFITQCLKREKVIACFLIAVISDIVLMKIGEAFFNEFKGIQYISSIVKILAIVYVSTLCYSVFFGAAPSPSSSRTNGGPILSMTSLSLFNPHSWIDTVLFIGTIAVLREKPNSFIMGATTSSAIWFLSLIAVFSLSLNSSYRSFIAINIMPLISKIILPAILILLVVGFLEDLNIK